MLDIIIYVALAIVIIALLIKYEFKKLEGEVFQSIKRLGIKALGLLAIINIFSSSNSELPESKEDNKESD